MDEIRKVKSWDELPPVVQAQGEVFSTRILEHEYRQMESKLSLIPHIIQLMDDGNYRAALRMLKDI